MDEEKKFRQSAEGLIDYIARAVSPFHAVLAACEELEDSGFEPLDFSEEWILEPGGRYYVPVFDSALIAFSVGTTQAERGNLRIAMAHGDFPCFAIKAKPDVISGKVGKLNVEPYGGMMNYSWLDRPLSIAGKVALKGEDPFHPEIRFVDFARPVATIPSLAIHMMREVNQGHEWNAQKELMPVTDAFAESLGDPEGFKNSLAEEIGCDADDILSYELFLYPAEKGEIVGLNETMISSARLDNLTSCYACIHALTHANRNTGLNVAVIFDNEEVGSMTRKGAGGSAFMNVLERIYQALEIPRETYLKDLTDGFAFSVDVAHCTHPNYPEKADPTHPITMNGGVVIKSASRQSYVGDCESVAITESLCAMANIPYQNFANRSDSKGGGTLGSIAAGRMPMRVQDIGVPLAAMHSARELMGIRDQYYLEQLLLSLYSCR